MRAARVEIGAARGRIAVFLDHEDAITLAMLYGPGDLACDELLDAARRAYPERYEDDEAAK